MSITPRPKGRISSGLSGLRKVSALRLLPAPERSFRSKLLPPVLAVLAASMIALGGYGALSFRKAVTSGLEASASVRLDTLEGRLTDDVARRVETARRWCAREAVVKAVRRPVSPGALRRPDGGERGPAATSSAGTSRPAAPSGGAFGVGGSPEPLNEAARAALRLRLSPSLQLEPAGEAARLLRELTTATPEVVGAIAVQASGIVVAATEVPPDAVLVDEPWFIEAMRDGTAVALSAPGSSLPPGAVAIAVAIHDLDDRSAVGALALTVPAASLGRSLSAGDWGRTAAFDRRGIALPGPGGSLPLSEDPDLAPLGDALGASGADAGTPDGTSRPPAVRNVSFRSESHLVWGRRIAEGPARGFSLAVAIPAELLDRPLRRGMAWRLSLAALALLAFLLVLLPPLAQVSSDIHALVDYARKTGSGDLGAAPPKLHRSDEIGTLGTALVSSLEGLRSSRAELERAKKTLEDRVEARTSELAHVNVELKRRAEELAAASRSKDEFLTNISHELRTPLNSIIGLTQLVREGVCDTKEESDQFLDQALLSARHLLTLINDVLDLAKLEAGKVVLDLSDVHAAEIVEDVRKIVEPLAAQKPISLEVQVPTDLPLCRADRLRLRQILVNLTQNAVKFTLEGRVSLRVRSSDGRRKLLFEVEDTGVGIPEEKRHTVFEKFVQAEAGTTRRFGGTGLGLPISRLLVEAMGGAIGIEGGSGGAGTRVWFTIPTLAGLEGR